MKVLDFGLAKIVDQTASADPLSSPTLTARATGIGVILGTAAYMSPEQARGKAVDKRADIWAFGVVLYEMLTGKRLFSGEDVSDTMAAVLRQTVAFEALPEHTPAAVRVLIERCLERDLRQRLRDIGEAGLARADPREASRIRDRRCPRPRARLSRAERSCRGCCSRPRPALAAVLLAAPRRRPSRRPGRVTRFSAGIGVPGSLAVDAGPAAVLSPDGRTVVLRVRNEGTTRLYARRLDQLAPVELVGSENANPFFSPDGSQVGFFASGALKTMPLAGGAVTTLTDAATGRGAAWDRTATSCSSRASCSRHRSCESRQRGRHRAGHDARRR